MSKEERWGDKMNKIQLFFRLLFSDGVERKPRNPKGWELVNDGGDYFILRHEKYGSHIFKLGTPDKEVVKELRAIEKQMEG